MRCPATYLGPRQRTYRSSISAGVFSSLLRVQTCRRHPPSRKTTAEFAPTTICISQSHAFHAVCKWASSFAVPMPQTSSPSSSCSPMAASICSTMRQLRHGAPSSVSTWCPVDQEGMLRTRSFHTFATTERSEDGTKNENSPPCVVLSSRPHGQRHRRCVHWGLCELTLTFWGSSHIGAIPFLNR